jgi:hypothetical protein
MYSIFEQYDFEREEVFCLDYELLYGVTFCAINLLKFINQIKLWESQIHSLSSKNSYVKLDK